MHYTVLTDEQLEAFNRPLKEGKAHFEVTSAIEGKSKIGNEIVSLILNVTDCEGNKGVVYDTLVSTENMTFKIKHFLESIGQGDRYNEGLLQPNSLYGVKGHCKLKWQKFKNRDYTDRIGVKDYISVDSKPSTTTSPNTGISLEPTNKNMSDDIPF